MEELTIKDLLEAGVHFGHQTRRWNPKMKKFIFTERNGIYIIDLKKSLELINKACEAIREITANGGSVLYVGTKPQSATIVKEEAERSGQFYVSNRWLGGMLTNYRKIKKSVKRLEHVEKMSSDGTYELLTKKEVLTSEKHKEKLLLMLGGIRDMNRIPGLLVVIDTKRENIAVREANRLGIPVCAIIDTNCDPDPIDYPIPGNDDAIRSIKVIISKITDAVLEGLQMRDEEETVSVMEPEKEIKVDSQKESVKKKESIEEPVIDEAEGKDKKYPEKQSLKKEKIKQHIEKKKSTETKITKSDKIDKKKHSTEKTEKKEIVKKATEEKKVEDKSLENKALKKKEAEKISAQEKKADDKGKEKKSSKIEE